MTKRLFEEDTEQWFGVTEYSPMPEEIWADIKGFNGIYKISNYGRVKTTIRTGCSVEYLKPTLNQKGYPTVTIRDSRRGIKTTRFVHRLVAEYFIPNPDNLPEVNHMDENKENNCVWNLEWCDHLYNIRYGTGIERNAKKAKKPVYQFNKNGELLNIWESVADAELWLGYDGANITRNCNGIRHSYNDCIWIYTNNKDVDGKLKKDMEWLNTHFGYARKKKVRQYTLDGELIGEYDGVRCAERSTGISSAHISDSALKGRPRKGYIWKYI